MEKKSKILAVGANPAWQKVLEFNALTRNSVNRAESMWAFASGKGINFARAARCWGRAEVDLLQFAGGDNGKLLLNDLARETLAVKTIASATPTRSCITCLSADDNSMTELIEPSQAPGTAAEAEALAYVESMLPQADALAICGQLPGGMDMDFYVKCVQMAQKSEKLLLIDSWKNIAQVLQYASGAILKINADELKALTGIDNVNTALKLLFDSYGLKAAAITNGSGNAYFAADGKLYNYTLPKLPKIVNPVGSGDTASAVLLSSLLDDIACEDAFAYALAAASANCLSMKCGEFELETALDLYEKITIESTDL